MHWLLPPPDSVRRTLASRKPDKVPRNYDRRDFHLDGCMDMEITFYDKTLTTTVCVKMDAVDQLLLSEVVCHQLEIVRHHPSIVAQKGARRL